MSAPLPPGQPAGSAPAPAPAAAATAAATRAQLLAWTCRHLGPADLLDPAGTAALLAQLPGWRLDGAAIARDFRLRDFRAAVGFADAIAAFADAQDHHPELALGYGRCLVRWSTHSAGGVTMNDLACAALTDAAFQRFEG